MSFVLDASVGCAWVFADETTDALDALLEQAGDEVVYVPAVWRLEVTNALVLAARRGRIPSDDVAAYWEQLERLAIERVAWAPPITRTVELCKKHELTAYDAEYLALAVWLRLPLATVDERLAVAARAEGVTVLGGLTS